MPLFKNCFIYTGKMPQFVDIILENVLGTASLETRLGVHKMQVEWPILGPDGGGPKFHASFFITKKHLS